VTRLVVGLGNPGARYRETPHNVGFRVIEELAGRWGVALDRRRVLSRAAAARRGEEEVWLLQPQTYMNRSGEAIGRWLRDFQVAPKGWLVVSDDFHLPLGGLRVRRKGSDGGHNGLASIIGAVGTEAFARLRIGVGEVRGDPEEFVLRPFSPADRPIVQESCARAADAVECWIDQGIEETMRRFN
jgi:PTH1 family peptidyl-tRNA hydrolase